MKFPISENSFSRIPFVTFSMIFVDFYSVFSLVPKYFSALVGLLSRYTGLFWAFVVFT